VLLGLALDAWSGADVKLPLERVQLAERLGYDSVWTAEAYGADALTPLAYLAASTSRIKLATGVVQISARTPAATAMAFATLESLAGSGRVIAGLGLSGPQIVEGWYGQPWAKPIARTRDYVAIMRKIFRREGPVAHDGRAITLPYAGADATGLGKPLRSILHPNPDLPIYLAAGGPENVALAAEVADGWIPMGLSPANAAGFRTTLEKGAARSGRDLATLAIHASTTVHLTDDVPSTIARMKPRVALYVGGMGAREMNFHFDVFCRLGYEAEATKIQDLYLDGHQADAIAAVPREMVEEIALIGSRDKIKDDLEVWKASMVTTMLLGAGNPDVMRMMAELVL
jgi:F420-dependent oxidoreductase-like protein